MTEKKDKKATKNDLTFELSVLFHACHVNRGLEPLKNYASLSLIAFANNNRKKEERLFK